MNNTSRRVNASPSNPSPNVVRRASDFRPSPTPLQVNDRRVSSYPTANDDNEGTNPLTAGLQKLAAPETAALRSAPVGTPRKARRSAEQVLEGLPTKYDEASYALQRIAANDLRTQKILNIVSPEALPLILEQRPDLARFFKS